MEVSKALIVFIVFFIFKSFEINPNYDFHFTGKPMCRPQDSDGKEEVTVQLFVNYSPNTYPIKTVKCNTTYTYRAIFASPTIESGDIYVRYTYKNNPSIFFTRIVPKDCNYKHYDEGFARYFCNVTGLEPK
uniref:Uncharacterized protein n=1 Tax=Strongyloides venezuelensis TaxID=75913 RepID=A0A0K0EZQ6_STRVS